MASIQASINNTLATIRAGISYAADKLGVPTEAICEAAGTLTGEAVAAGTTAAVAAWGGPIAPAAPFAGAVAGSVSADLTTQTCNNEPVNTCEVFGNAVGALAGYAAGDGLLSGLIDGAIAEGSATFCQEFSGGNNAPEYMTPQSELQNGAFVFVPMASGDSGGGGGGVQMPAVLEFEEK